MGTGTYPDPSVKDILFGRYLPVRAEIMSAVQERRRYKAIWTPSYEILESGGYAVSHSDGWLPPSEFAPLLLLGIGHVRFRRHRYDDAFAAFEEVRKRYPLSSVAPEALYYMAVSRYMSTRDPKDLHSWYAELQRWHPDSPWALRTLNL